MDEEKANTDEVCFIRKCEFYTVVKIEKKLRKRLRSATLLYEKTMFLLAVSFYKN